MRAERTLSAILARSRDTLPLQGKAGKAPTALQEDTMNTTTTTVVHVATGAAFVVPVATYRPSHDARLRAMLADADRCSASCCTDRTTACVGCGRFVAVDAPTATVHVNGERVAVAAAQADRVVNDHPAFIVGAPVAYHAATTLPTCAACNGSPTVRATVLVALEAAALGRLRRFAL